MVVGPNDPTMGVGMASLASTARGLVVAQPRAGWIWSMSGTWPRGTSPPYGLAEVLGGSSSLVTTSAVTSWSGSSTGSPDAGCGALLPTRLAQVSCRVGDVAQRYVSLKLALTTDALTLLVRDCVVDAGRTRTELGLSPRSLDETLTSMADAGVITARQAGQPVLARA